MRIVTRLRIISTVTVVALVGMAPVLIGSLLEFRQAKGDYALAETIKVNFFERASLQDQYFLYREERLHGQWDKNKETADRLLHQAQSQFQGSEDRETLERLRLNIEATWVLFHRIVGNTHVMQTAAGNRPVYEELDRRLYSQLLLKAAAVRDTATTLTDAASGRVERTYQRLSLLIGLAALTLALVTILISIQIGRLIHRRLEPLHRGAEIIANGDLDHRIDTAGGDEFTDLALSVNAMTDKLQAFTRRLEAEIAERKQAEEKLHLAASVFTHAREGIMITAADGAIVEVNDTFCRITGYGRDEVLGRNPRLLNSGRHDPAFYAALWRDLVATGYWNGEIWNRRKNGEVYPEMLTIGAVRDAEGQTRQYVALFADITSIKEHEHRLETIAHYDALTGLPNRVLSADRLHQAMAQAQRRGQRLAAAYLDLDGFKAINDSYGHSVGDQLLIAVATRMRQALREVDTLARLGGDEFVAVLLDLPDIEASVPMLTRLLAAAAQPVRIGDHDLQVSASIGVTFYPQVDEVDADQLLRQADQAMYQAKLAGKNRYHVFDAEQDRSVRGHHESLEHIRRALTEGEFVLHFQPKVNMRTGTVVGAEALIRWRHPEKGLLPPAVFLPVIEDHPLAVELGEWVIDHALIQMTCWRAAGLAIPVSVNIGARQMQQADFVERLGLILAAHPHVEPGDLELEVLETSALEDLARASQVIQACREIGVRFALDDFGTGYSSLTYLKRLPVTQLKIDQSFVRDMLDDPDDLAILEGVLGLAAAFRRQVIAEGVETVEHGEMLLRLGCELAQGYGIARPMPGHELPDWAEHWRPDPAWLDLPAASRDDLPLLFAGVEHRAWIAAIVGHLKGAQGTPPPLDLHRCRFGAWLDAEGLARYDAQPTFRAIEPMHARIHALAEALCRHKAQGQVHEALAGLVELHALRDGLLDNLKRLVRTNRH